jgi:hypothetical protein
MHPSHLLPQVYAQGMSVAAKSAECLARVLQAALPPGAAPGARHAAARALGPSFQKQLAGVVAPAWMMATSEDQRYPGTRVQGVAKPPRLLCLYIDALCKACHHSTQVRLQRQIRVCTSAAEAARRASWRPATRRLPPGWPSREVLLALNPQQRKPLTLPVRWSAPPPPPPNTTNPPPPPPPSPAGDGYFLPSGTLGSPAHTPLPAQHAGRCECFACVHACLCLCAAVPLCLGCAGWEASKSSAQHTGGPRCWRQAAGTAARRRHPSGAEALSTSRSIGHHVPQGLWQMLADAVCAAWPARQQGGEEGLKAE